MPDMLGMFTILTEDLDHPEDLVWDPLSGRIYAGGEAGQIYAVSLDGEVEQVADSGGGILGLAVDADGTIYACDEGRAEVLRVDPRSGDIEVYSRGTSQRPMIEPNSCAFDAAGSLYVTDSSDWEGQNGVIYRVAPGGETVVWTDALRRYPNGCCLAPDGRSLYVVESSLPGIWRVPIADDGRPGDPASVIELPDAHVPDGIALDEAGALYIACYRPDRVYRFCGRGALKVVADDPLGLKLNTPTNVAFVGPALDRLAIANVGEWHILIGDVGASGAPLVYPSIHRDAPPAVDWTKEE
jgi:gluconolactonase